MPSDARGQIRDFITGKFPGVEFADGDDIFTLGFATSLFAMQLVMFVEKTFGFEIGNEDLEMANFRSVDAMAALVDRNLDAVSAGR
ncbi:phosphopantetheine-binding protein [Amycolatopsis samaneae]|uniref:Phosphopantetheine-binding protein n=1 Tax=Amycolatopsis samaneae TaxID=664691 RepID=A0ABW5GWF5_9PSEU